MKKLPTWVEINLDNLHFNLENIKRLLNKEVEILLTVKADAYGHGAVQVAHAAGKAARMLGVATVDEALELEHSGIPGENILILSPILEREIPFVIDQNFVITISSAAFAGVVSSRAEAAQKKIKVHIEVDTGMGRTGIPASEAAEEIIRIGTLSGIAIGGIYTHFPSADIDSGFTSNQIDGFLKVLNVLREKGVSIPILHSANSSAIARFKHSHMDMVRPGLLAYGHLPDGSGCGFPARPVMRWMSRLVQIRRLPKGHGISYGRTFITSRNTLVGIVPVGYGHGYPFRVSNKGQMLILGTRVPVLGRVTMDMTMVDLTDLGGEPSAGEEVVIFGAQGDEYISLHELAVWADSIPYEILCGISKRVPRTYLRKGRIETYKSLLGIMANHVCS